MMGALCTSETSVLIRAIRHNIPEDTILHSHRRENPKSYVEYKRFCREREREHRGLYKYTVANRIYSQYGICRHVYDLNARFHITVSYGILVIAIKPKSICRFHKAVILFRILHSQNFRKNHICQRYVTIHNFRILLYGNFELHPIYSSYQIYSKSVQQFSS
jgi:hypothetical protein